VSEAGRALRQALALAALSVVAAAAVHSALVLRFGRGEFRETFFDAAANPGIRLITLEEAEDLWRTNAAVFFDARSPTLYDAGHVPGAGSIPVPPSRPVIPAEVLEIAKDRTLVVYCEGGSSCMVSQALAQRFNAEGFKDVRVFDGGWAAWTAAGLPVERSEKR
jgi:rhodanese-related sulfurtransferase